MPQSFGRIEGTLKEMLPLGRRVLVLPAQTPDYKGNIIIPESCKESAPTTGKVIKLGFELQDDESNRLREGDTVCFSKYGGVQFTFDNGTKLLIVDEADVLAVVRGEISVRPDVESVSTNGHK